MSKIHIKVGRTSDFHEFDSLVSQKFYHNALHKYVSKYRKLRIHTSYA